MPSVTCVIPTHRRPDQLANALRSVLSQTATPDRVIVVNDAEEDPVSRVIQAHIKSSKVEILHMPLDNDRGCGASRSRNAGLKKATTDFVAFLDDDDLWDPEFLEKTVPNDTIDLAFSWIDVRSKDGVLLFERRASPGLVAEQVVANNPGFTGSNIVVNRRSALRLGGFDENLRAYNDIDFLVRALESAQNVKITEEVLAHQILSPGEHLSSRSRPRALAIRAYREKHGHLLSPSAKRRLNRDYHLALRGADSSPPERLFHFIAMWAWSSPQDLRRTFAQRAAGAQRAYE